MKPTVTIFKNVYVTNWRRKSWEAPKLTRTKNGQRVLSLITNAMQEGHTVAMRTDYDDEGREILNAEITYAEP